MEGLTLCGLVQKLIFFIVFLISEIYYITLEFTYLFLINAAMMALVSVFIIFLPIQKHETLAS